MVGSQLAGPHGLLRLHRRAWGCPAHSGGEAQRLRSHWEAVALEPPRAKATRSAASDHLRSFTITSEERASVEAMSKQTEAMSKQARVLG